MQADIGDSVYLDIRTDTCRRRLDWITNPRVKIIVSVAAIIATLLYSTGWTVPIVYVYIPCRIFYHESVSLNSGLSSASVPTNAPSNTKPSTPITGCLSTTYGKDDRITQPVIVHLGPNDN